MNINRQHTPEESRRPAQHGPFGETLRSTGLRASKCNWRFAAKSADPQTRQQYYGYRYYAASLGRWINRDPVYERGGPNVYATANRPLDSIDPLGLANEPPELCTRGNDGRLHCLYSMGSNRIPELYSSVDAAVALHWIMGLGTPLVLRSENILDDYHGIPSLDTIGEAKPFIREACRGYQPLFRGVPIRIPFFQESGFATLGKLSYMIEGNIKCCMNNWRFAGTIAPQSESFDFHVDVGQAWWKNLEITVGGAISWNAGLLFKTFPVRFYGKVPHEEHGLYRGD